MGRDDRNRRLRAAAAVAGLAALLIGAAEVIRTVQYAGDVESADFVIGEGVRAASYLLGLVGWAMVFLALESEID